MTPGISIIFQVRLHVQEYLDNDNDDDERRRRWGAFLFICNVLCFKKIVFIKEKEYEIGCVDLGEEERTYCMKN